MHRYLLRPLLVFLTLGMLLAAIFQVAGRAMFSVLDELEPAANDWLSGQQIHISGLLGDWHFLNPVVHIQRLTLPAGHLENLTVELDWIESLIRNRLIFRRVYLEEGRLILARTTSGWGLLGAKGGAEFDPLDTLYHSDELDLSLAIGFTRDDSPALAKEDVSLGFKAINRGGVHRHRMHLNNAGPDCESVCTADFSVDIEEKIPLIRPRREQLRSDIDGFTVPAVIVGVSALRVRALTAAWWREEALSGGTLDLSFDGLELSEEGELSGSLSGLSRGSRDLHFGEINSLELAGPNGTWQAPEILLRYDSPVAQLWFDKLDLGAAAAFVEGLFSEDQAPRAWLEALKLEGSAKNLRAFARLPEFEMGFAATLSDLNLEGYKGAPWIRGGVGELIGSGRAFEMNLNSNSLDLQFPETFRERWALTNLQGVLQAWIGPDYFALRGFNFRAEIEDRRVSAGFGLSRPSRRFDETLTLLANVDHTSVESAKRFIPYKLPSGLPEWLEQGPRAGLLSTVAFAYHGQIHTRPFELARRVEFAARIDDGEILYHADWPEVTGLAGSIAVAGREVRIDVEEGLNRGGESLAGSRIVLGNNASYADIDLVSRMSLHQALDFVRTTPLAQWMAFITPGWSGEGMLDMRGRMHIPLKLDQSHIGELQVEDELAIDLDIDLDGVDLSLADFRVELGAMQGNLHYRFPHGVSGEGVKGTFFERPATFAARADDDTVTFRVNGQAAYEDVLSTLDIADPGNLLGGFDFLANLHIELGEDISRLKIETDLTGLAVRLPGGLSKQADDAVPTEVDIRFLDEYQSLSFSYGAAAGWLHVDGTPLRGSIGISGPPPLVDMSRNELAVGGHIEGFAIDEVIPDRAAPVRSDIASPDSEQPKGQRLPIDLRLVDLMVDHIDVGAVQFRDARLNGRVGTADLQVDVYSPDLVGTVAQKGEAPINLHLQLLRLPGGDDEGESGDDPLDPELIQALAQAQVTVDSFHIGEADYGAWSFGLLPDTQGLAITDLQATLRGVAITADRLYWQAEPNETQFEGTLTAGNLAEVLPLWGYAPSVMTETAVLTGELNWRGSPAMVDITRLVGEARFHALNGRFHDVETGGTGALRIFSLINFSTIAKRLKFDFSDVSGEGVIFDSLSATAQFDENLMTFVEPLEVLGSGSNFRIAGSVDLKSQQLHNEMIVTLPVSRSLPWYAAYVAIANPLVGLGVLVGERVLRKPLEQFSSAKYQISGTLSDPELKFVSVWDTSVDQPQTPLDTAPEPPTDENH